MRILVYPHDLDIGGSQINAIELAYATANLGHDVTIFGYPGSLVPRIRELGMPFVPSPFPRRRPSPSVMDALTQTVVEREIDVLHGYEWPPALECWLVARRQQRTTFATVMSMAVADFLPRTVPLIVGTEQIRAAELQMGRTNVVALQPPVDLVANNPNIDIDDTDLHHNWPVDDAAIKIVTVTRLAHELKLEGLLVAIDVIGELARSTQVQLVIVGDGPARREVAERAETVNCSVGPNTIILTGAMNDPRPAYRLADVVLGMGGSALRALAFAKPLVVQGEQGFWRLLDPDNVDEFLWTGWYGIGGGTNTGAGSLRQALDPIIDNPARRVELGNFALRVAQQTCSLESAAMVQERLYYAAVSENASRLSLFFDTATSAGRFGRYMVRRHAPRIRRKSPREDFNSRPVAAHGPSRPTNG